eukprot:4197993-Pyramimonas_sp.AAC.1
MLFSIGVTTCALSIYEPKSEPSPTRPSRMPHPLGNGYGGAKFLSFQWKGGCMHAIFFGN